MITPSLILEIIKKPLLLLSVIFSVFFYSSSFAVVIEKIVAVVDDEIITLSDVTKYRERLKLGKLNDDLLRPNKSMLLKSRAHLVDHMINEKLLDSEVKKNNLSVTLEKVEQAIRKVTQQNQITRHQLKSALLKEGISFSIYQDFMKTRLERQSLVEKEVSSKIKISEDDIVAHYISKKGHLSKDTFEYTVAHILILPSNHSKGNAKNRTLQVLDKLKEGHSFEDLASQYSEDPNFSSGGLLGTFKAGEMLPELESAITQLKVNQHSELVKSKLGYHVLKLLRKRIVSDPVFLKEKSAIYNFLFQKAFKKQFKSWLSGKRQEAFIRKNN